LIHLIGWSCVIFALAELLGVRFSSGWDIFSSGRDIFLSCHKVRLKLLSLGFGQRRMAISLLRLRLSIALLWLIAAVATCQLRRPLPA
jgi:hypothetical protein